MISAIPFAAGIGLMSCCRECGYIFFLLPENKSGHQILILNTNKSDDKIIAQSAFFLKNVSLYFVCFSNSVQYHSKTPA
jgi:hypothetical protein